MTFQNLSSTMRIAGAVSLALTLHRDLRKTHRFCAIMTDEDWSSSSGEPATIPPLLSPFGSYPNPLGLTDDDRKLFFPVVVFPTQRLPEDGGPDCSVSTKKVLVRDLTRPSGKQELATEEQRRLTAQGACPPELLNLNGEEGAGSSSLQFAIGRYDEDRAGLYESELFHDTSHSIDSFAGKRTLHVGIDLGGPVLTPVHAFWEGLVHAAGYNPALGDYGHAVVVHHKLPTGKSAYALYGHLHDSSRWKPGDAVGRGQEIGKMGHIHQNGGWVAPHVHFQLSLHPPETHDMPGAVSLEDRERALHEYPDPRYVLGPLY